MQGSRRLSGGVAGVRGSKPRSCSTGFSRSRTEACRRPLKGAAAGVFTVSTPPSVDPICSVGRLDEDANRRHPRSASRTSVGEEKAKEGPQVPIACVIMTCAGIGALGVAAFLSLRTPRGGVRREETGS